MSVDYRVLCNEKPDDVAFGDSFHDVEIVAVNVFAPDHRPIGLREEYGIDPAVVFSLNCHHSACKYVDDLADRIARNFDGVVWCDQAEQNLLFDYREVEMIGELPSFRETLDRWAELTMPEVEQQNEAAEKKRERQQQLRERIADGEDVEGVMDFEMEWDDEDLDNL